MKQHLLILAIVAASAPACLAQVVPRPVPTSSAAQPLVTSESTSETSHPRVDGAISMLIDSFFDLLAKNQIDKAYDRLTVGTKIAEQAKDVATLRAKTQQAIILFGDVRGHELVQVKNVGTHLLAATYLSLGRDFPLRWRFYFYRSDGPWKLIDIRVDDRLVDMFDEKPVPPAPGAGSSAAADKP